LTPALSIPSPADVTQALENLQRLLDHSAELVRNGGTVDLRGLDGEVRTLTEAVATLPLPEARAQLPLLDAVLQSLGQLERTLTDIQGTLLGGTEKASRIMRAAAAYRRPDEP